MTADSTSHEGEPVAVPKAGPIQQQPPTEEPGRAADILASMVVFLVALPLCIGIAVACGVPAERGLVTGIVGGLFVGVFSGAPLLVSGPAASLIVPVAGLVQEHGLAALGPVVMLAGVWQVLAGVFKLGRWFRAVAPAVIMGMLVGIGILIFVSQLHVAIDGEPEASFVDNVLSFPAALHSRLVHVDHEDDSGRAAVVVATATLLLLWAWNRFRPQKLRLIPGHLVSLSVVTIAVLLFEPSVMFLDISSSFFDGLEPVSLGGLQGLLDLDRLGLSLVFAFVASAATLLTANAIDQRQSHSQTNYDQEIFAQGLGNLLTGGLGGLPMTGVIVRSSVNVDAGARTRLSTILHGIWLLLFVAVAPQLLEAIPRASLGAILVYTGYRLIDIRGLTELNERGRAELWIALITLGGVIFIDLFAGILAGLAAAVAKLVYTFARLDIHSEAGRTHHHIYLIGSATFLHLPRLVAALDAVPDDRELHVHIDRLAHIDHACLELLSSAKTRRESDGGPAMVVEWRELTERYHHARVGMDAEASRSLLSAVWAEWKKLYAPRNWPSRNRESRTDWLDASRVEVGLQARSLEEVLERAATLLAPSAAQSAQEIATALAARVDGHVVLGHGVSIPHVGVEGLSRSLVALITSRTPVAVGSEQADIFFVLLAPDSDPQQHLESLANVGRFCLDEELVQRLRASESPDAAVELLQAAVPSVFGGPGRPGAELLAVLEVPDTREAGRARRLVAEVFAEPIETLDEQELMASMRHVLKCRPDTTLIVFALEARDTAMLESLLEEHSRAYPTETWRVHLLQRENLYPE